jgi:HEAT repeat protein
LENGIDIMALIRFAGLGLCVLCVSFMLLPLAARSAQQVSLAELADQAKSTDEAVQLTAIQELGQRGAPAVSVLIDLLKAESPAARGHAARSLGTIGAPAKEAAQGLIDLLADPEQSVRRQALSALAAIRPGPKVTVPLFVKLMQDSDPGVRMRVMQAVADAKADAVPALVEALKNDGATYWACLILRDIGPDATGAVPALEDKLKDKRPEIRREAILALAAIGAPKAVEKIVPLLKDEPSQIAATYALGVLAQIPAGAESILRANAKSKDALLSTTSLWALARVHPDDVPLKRAALTQLVARLKDQDPFVRTAAARALASLPPSPEIAGPIIEKALAGADETTVHYMLDTLAGLGPQVVPRLIAGLKHKALRAQIAYILGQMGEPAAAATNELAGLLNDEDPNVGIEAAHALAKIGPRAKAAVPALIGALKQPEGATAYGAAYALGVIGPAAAAAEPELLNRIKQPENSLSLISAWSLIKIRGASPDTASKVLPTLLAGLESRLPISRQTAADTLADLGPLAGSAATAALERATKDDDEAVRQAATKALKSIKR